MGSASKEGHTATKPQRVEGGGTRTRVSNADGDACSVEGRKEGERGQSRSDPCNVADRHGRTSAGQLGDNGIRQGHAIRLAERHPREAACGSSQQVPTRFAGTEPQEVGGSPAFQPRRVGDGGPQHPVGFVHFLANSIHSIHLPKGDGEGEQRPWIRVGASATHHHLPSDLKILGGDAGTASHQVLHSLHNQPTTKLRRRAVGAHAICR